MATKNDEQVRISRENAKILRDLKKLSKIPLTLSYLANRAISISADALRKEIASK